MKIDEATKEIKTLREMLKRKEPSKLGIQMIDAIDTIISFVKSKRSKNESNKEETHC